MFTTGETVGLAEWVIADTCLVHLIHPGGRVQLHRHRHRTLQGQGQKRSKRFSQQEKNRSLVSLSHEWKKTDQGQLEL